MLKLNCLSKIIKMSQNRFISSRQCALACRISGTRQENDQYYCLCDLASAVRGGGEWVSSIGASLCWSIHDRDRVNETPAEDVNKKWEGV